MPYLNYNDNRLFYREQGEGKLLILLPGNTASSVWHEGEMAWLSRHYRVAALDFLGTGRSDRVANWPREWFFQGACQAEALAEFLKEESCIVMGTSGGGVVALLMAIHFPKRVSAVVADSCVEIFRPENLHQELSEREKRSPESVAFWETAHGDDWENVIAADSRLLLQMAEKGGDCFDGTLGRIQCPVLLTASLQDSTLAPDAALQICRMGKKIEESRIFLSHSGDHPFMWTNPDEFREIAEIFLKRIS